MLVSQLSCLLKSKQLWKVLSIDSTLLVSQSSRRLNSTAEEKALFRSVTLLVSQSSFVLNLIQSSASSSSSPSGGAGALKISVINVTRLVSQTSSWLKLRAPSKVFSMNFTLLVLRRAVGMHSGAASQGGGWRQAVAR